jgi:hypothetical protein
MGFILQDINKIVGRRDAYLSRNQSGVRPRIAATYILGRTLAGKTSLAAHHGRPGPAHQR